MTSLNPIFDRLTIDLHGPTVLRDQSMNAAEQAS